MKSYTAQTCGGIQTMSLLEIRKTMKHTLLFTCSLIAAFGLSANADTYNGNGDTSFGGPVGNGNLVVSDDGANITFTLNSSGSLGGNDLVIYIDSILGGFSSTTGFQDDADGGRSAVSGYSGSGQSVLTFADGFLPDYAIDVGNTYASLFELANGGANSLSYITGASQSSSSPYSLTLSLADLGLTPGAGQSLKLFGTLISETGYRSTEAIAGDDSGSAGWNTFIQTSDVTYSTTAAPEPSTLALFGISGVAALLAVRRKK